MESQLVHPDNLIIGMTYAIKSDITKTVATFIGVDEFDESLVFKQTKTPKNNITITTFFTLSKETPRTYSPILEYEKVPGSKFRIKTFQFN